MERMDMQSRNQYLKVLRERYLKAKAKTKKEKSLIVDRVASGDWMNSP